MATEMRRRLFDYARRRLSEKRGGGVVIHEPLPTSAPQAPAAPDEDMEATLAPAAIAQLNGTFPRAARVVQLRYLAGLSNEETAARLAVSVGTVKRDWTFARAWRPPQPFGAEPRVSSPSDHPSGTA